VVDRHAPPPVRGPVVVKGGEFLEIRREYRLLDPPVEPEQLGLVLVDDLAAAQEPVFQVLVVGWHVLGLGRTVERRVLRVLYIAREVHPAIHEPPVLGTMAGDAEDHVLAPDRRAKVADQVALRAHPDRVPLCPVGVVQGESIVVFGGWHHELGTRLTEQRRPFVGIESRGGESGDEILVAER
jgi:hypothetical protein